ncbi:MAG: FecR domain-containing protein, partial [Bacteroidales bacterium]|nr:FecR domain-containing protein [Bacteroidales bacterium]
MISVAKYAAVILIAFFSGKYIYQEYWPLYGTEISYNEISAPPGQIAHLTLSDGTLVYVNSCSSLKYPTTFNAKQRKVFLSGEAYFSVQKGSKPFWSKQAL